MISNMGTTKFILLDFEIFNNFDTFKIVGVYKILTFGGLGKFKMLIFLQKLEFQEF